ncbi:SprT-like protein [Oceanobacillus limi]|uniref:Protein SprT-like n=1 Tax=Oceanobacillus limi TaxID=930131 RepID=A0A1I0H991_9BACI|nr:SprT family protein [Oceanobacillus limi]SET79406.1 SprT-like protein [Oceanobacillus limi]
MSLLNEKQLFNLVNDISIKYFHKPFIDRVYFNHRLRTTGGRYIPGKRVIELNPKYAIEMDHEEFVGIIKHELCHYHLHIEGKGYKHGDAEFKKLLKETGSPRHCNPLPSSKKKVNYRYECMKCHYIYERTRRVNTNRYGCGRCRGKLKLLGRK